MTSASSTTTGRRAPRQPLPAARARTTAAPRRRVRGRRRRLAGRLLAAAAVAALAVLLLGRLAGDDPVDPAEVAADIREQVTRDIISRTDDYSVTVGPLDCVALHPDRGNCLADVKFAGHRSDNVMVAVTYTADGGGYDLVIKMP